MYIVFQNMYESFSFSVSNCQVIFSEMHISENPIFGCFGVKVFLVYCISNIVYVGLF